MLRKCLTNKHIKIQDSLKRSLHKTLCLKTTTGIAILDLKDTFILDWLLEIRLVDQQIFFLIMTLGQL